MENLKIVDSLQIDKSYFFMGSIDLIENSKLKTDIIFQKRIFLGKFIGFIGILWNHDWLDHGKAQFEHGTISCANYDKIIPCLN
jgi:hypothetical protein